MSGNWKFAKRAVISAKHNRSVEVVSQALLLLTLSGGWDIYRALSQAAKIRKDDSLLSEASELCQDLRRTSHLSKPKHFMLSEAS